MKRIYVSCVAALVCAASFSAGAQEYVTGGFETNTIYYMQDEVNQSTVPEGNLGSNNYLKLDFGKGSLEGGLQAEHYMPALIGYPYQLDGFHLTNKYIRIRDNGFSVTFGDFYEQFGSGLLYRSYEDRALGINTSVQGVHLSWNYGGILSVKALLGTPRIFMSYSEEARVAGADLSLNLARAVGIESFNLALEGSFFGRHQGLDYPVEGLSPDENGVSARAAFDWQGLGLKGEYVGRNSGASAILAEASYTSGGLGANLSFRKLNSMILTAERGADQMYNLLNYLPALTQQHSYSLASLNPYIAQVNGETAAQADVYYFFPRKTLLGGSKGMKAHFNFSTAYGPKENPQDGTEFYFRDITADVERWWGKQIKTIFLYSWQISNNRVGAHPSYELWNSHIVVADVTYKINKTNSLRTEFQHLFSKTNEGNWAALSMEYTIAPSLSFSASDMWNYGLTGNHFYNGSISYSHSRTRCALSFGRFKQGFQCSGGVCRKVPAYTGANLSITTSF